ncbi:PIG-L deacetylase family protein [Pararobbsia silviterrae]|uniref:PIG-L deacetylase family protein n=1 Tax=Pararobbsia silviterrae TaxID=1792498 RepID=UPI001313E7F5|nr:PIG-L family deacetylase [Pararobbsia silviterrae]
MTHSDNAKRGAPERRRPSWDEFDTLPELQPDRLVPLHGRAVFIAPHPDDEVLGMGGLMVRLARLQRKLALIAVTDGDASHRNSTVWTADRLRETRPNETREALQRLRAYNVDVTRLRFGDGTVGSSERALQSQIEHLIHADDVVITTWRFDGHPDHEATGRAAAAACVASGAHLVEAPIWAWHDSAPGDTRLPWGRARRLSLDASTHARKRHAIDAFTSQLEDDPSNQQKAVLSDATLTPWLRPFEIYLV